MRTGVARVIMLRVVVIPYRRFGAIYLSRFQLTLQDGTDRMPGNVGKELPLLPAKESRRELFSSPDKSKLQHT